MSDIKSTYEKFIENRKSQDEKWFHENLNVELRSKIHGEGGKLDIGNLTDIVFIELKSIQVDDKDCAVAESYVFDIYKNALRPDRLLGFYYDKSYAYQACKHIAEWQSRLVSEVISAFKGRIQVSDDFRLLMEKKRTEKFMGEASKIFWESLSDLHSGRTSEIHPLEFSDIKSGVGLATDLQCAYTQKTSELFNLLMSVCSINKTIGDTGSIGY